MKLTNTQLENFIGRIKLKRDRMPKFREQVDNLKEKLETKIKNDDRNGLKVTKYLIAGSWKKGTILRPSGDIPIDIDLVLFVEGDSEIQNDLKKLHDFIVEYLGEIYPSKDIKKDIDAEGNTKSVTITFTGTGLQVDIVPVIPITQPKEYVWQPQRAGGGKYITSVTGQLDFASTCKNDNQSYASTVRAIKWWRNFKELRPEDDDNSGLSSFAIELILAYLDITKGVEQNIEECIIRFFQFVSTSNFPIIKFKNAINNIPAFDTPIFIGDPTNNENNTAKKLDDKKWNEIIKEANDAFESLNIAQSKNFEGETVDEWKRVFGPSFNINEEN
jgi:tRNA nucleotidyltransferase (CCA-adding enzyme)